MKFDSRRLRNEVVVVVGLGTRELLSVLFLTSVPACLYVLNVFQAHLETNSCR